MASFIPFDDRGVLEYLVSEEGKKNTLPTVSIACSPSCNMRCPHCIYDAGKKKPGALTKKEKLQVLEESWKLGARFLQICHEGEPFVDDATLDLVALAAKYSMATFLYTNASLITPEIAHTLYDYEVCLGVKCDSLNPATFNAMLGALQAEKIYQGIEHLLRAGYNRPVVRNGRKVTRLGLVCTLTSLNTKDIEEVRDVARFAWDNSIFFGAARLERGGRAQGTVWDAFRIPEQKKVVAFIDWCSEQTGINYWDAQPTPYCIGVCGIQVSDNGGVWVTEYGGSCDFTEPDGESFPEKIIILGNVRRDPLPLIVQQVWSFRKKRVADGVLERKRAAYEASKDTYPNGLQDCGSARTHTLFMPFYDYVTGIVSRL